MFSITDYSSQDYTTFYMYGQEQQQYPSQDYNTEASVAMILDEAEKLYNEVVQDCITKVITDHTFNKSSIPLLLRTKFDIKLGPIFYL